MNRKTLFALVFCLALALLVACGAPEPSPEVIPPTATSPTATAAPTQAPTPANTPTTEPAPAAPALSKPTRHALFIQAWMLINDRYVYPDYGGLDWEVVRDEYTEKVAAAASDKEFYDLMRHMVDLLGDDYSHFLSPDAVALEEAIYENLEILGGIGVSLGEFESELVIIQAFPDGPAFEEGLRPGERIVAVDGVPREHFSSFDEVRLAIIGEAGTEVVLIGPHTISAGEFFAAGMQLHGRATIVGLPSAGNTEFISSHELSDGSVLSITEWVYQLPDGTLIEGRGVQPDVVVDMDWDLYGADDDPQLLAAIEVLGSE